jgi:hypothetical protein
MFLAERGLHYIPLYSLRHHSFCKNVKE